MLRRFLACFALFLIGNAGAAGIADLTNSDATTGLKQALSDGSLAAVGKLGVENGFFANPKVKIPLPPALQRVEGALRIPTIATPDYMSPPANSRSLSTSTSSTPVPRRRPRFA